MKLDKLVVASMAFAVAAVSLSSCNNAQQADTDDKIVFSKIEESSAYTLKNTAEDYNGSVDLTFACKATLLVPENIYGNDIQALKDAVYKAVFDTTYVVGETFIEGCLAKVPEDLDFSAEKTELADDMQADGMYSIRATVNTLVDEDILTYAVQTYLYPPRAAHGMHSTKYVNYDMDNNKVLNLQDILSAPGIEALPDILRQEAEMQESVIGKTSINALPAENNFYINANREIVFAYQPYEVASYAQGEIQISLQPYLIRQYLTEYGIELLLNVD